MSKKWFRNKTYGYGWVPVTWEGWLCLFVFLAFNIWDFLRINARVHSISDLLINYILPFIVSFTILIIICIKKGERPRWQWGEKKKDE